MFVSQRNPRPNGVRRPPSRVPFRPILEALEDRITPTGSITVTNFLDTVGGNSLRDAVAQADANTSGVFTINLIGGTYTLSQNSPLLLNNTNPGTTIVIQGSTDPDNPTILNETGLSRVLEVSKGTHAILDNVNVQNGQAQDAPADATGFNVVGGGLLNDGGFVALTNDVFLTNRAVAAPGTAGMAGGGGIFSVGGTLVLDTVQLSNNVAQGGSGNGATQKAGGNAFGGGLGEINTTVIVTNVPVTPSDLPALPAIPFDPSALTRPLLTVSLNNARGGDGAAGLTAATKATFANGTDAGGALGGGLWASGGQLSIVAASFVDNFVRGGDGGDGASNSKPTLVGNAGNGGSAGGGGLAAESEVSTQLTVQASTFASNAVVGGNGGNAGDGSANGARGGNGGDAGLAFGGGVEVFTPATTLQMFNSTVADNFIDGGIGGNGGNSIGVNGGNGGAGGSAVGAGMDLRTGAAPDTLTNITIASNTIDEGGGAGGKGGTTDMGNPGTTGDTGIATGGGLNSDGSATLINSAVALNVLAGGDTTTGAPDVSNTISENTRFTYISNPLGDNNLRTSAVLFNAATQTPNNNNAYGGFKDALGNLVPTDPLFAVTPLIVFAPQAAARARPGPNGGPTDTIELQPGSYLIGKGTASATGATLDQRGVPRGNRVDLGAVEFAGLPVTVIFSNVAATSQGVTATVPVIASAVGSIVNEGSVQVQLFNASGTLVDQQTVAVSDGAAGPVTLGSNLTAGSYTLQASYTDSSGFFQAGTATPRTVTVSAPPSPPPPPPAPPPSPPPPSLISAILGLYIAEVEKDIGFGDPAAVQSAIDFNAQFTVIFGINIAPLIEQLADTNVRNARGGG